MERAVRWLQRKELVLKGLTDEVEVGKCAGGERAVAEWWGEEWWRMVAVVERAVRWLQRKALVVKRIRWDSGKGVLQWGQGCGGVVAELCAVVAGEWQSRMVVQM